MGYLKVICSKSPAVAASPNSPIDNKLVRVLDHRVHSEDVRHAVEEAYATRLSDEDIQTALAFLDTDLGKKVMQCQPPGRNRPGLD